MPCDQTPFVPNQTLTERKKQVRETIDEMMKALVRGDVKAIIGPQGAVAFEGWTNRRGITDNCAYRRIMASGGTLAKAKLAKAEALAGRSINKTMVAQGHHSHDGKTWHGGHK